jgi:hypothetical protein
MSLNACGEALRTSHSRLVMPMCSSARIHGKKATRGPIFPAFLLYNGYPSCRVLAVEGGLGRSISGMQIAPFAGVVPPEPERAWQDAPSLHKRTNRLMKHRSNTFRAAMGATQKAKKKDTYEHR